MSCRGVVPAVQSLDCISVFAHNVQDAHAVLQAFSKVDAQDPYTAEVIERPITDRLRFGVPKWDQLEFCGDTLRANAFKSHLQMIAESRSSAEFDFAPFQKVAALLYEGPWVAARTAAVGDFIEKHTDDPTIDPTVKKIIMSGFKLTAIDVFRGFEELKRLERATKPTWESIDVMVVPSTPSMFTLEQVKQEPVKYNSLLGTYTNFVNLLGLCALTLPAGRLSNGLPASITVIAPNFDDHLLAQVGRWWETRVRATSSL